MVTAAERDSREDTLAPETPEGRGHCPHGPRTLAPCVWTRALTIRGRREVPTLAKLASPAGGERALEGSVCGGPRTQGPAWAPDRALGGLPGSRARTAGGCLQGRPTSGRGSGHRAACVG